MIPVAEPCLSPEDISRAQECLATGWISSSGKYIQEFEQAWASYCRMPYGISVCNGTAALYVALELLDLNPGDEVILPTFTIISCAQAVTGVGAVPVLVDSDPLTWQMNIEEVRRRVTDRTKAIMAVHIYGHPVDMDPLLAICREFDLKLVEDAAEAHGALYKSRPCGSFGDISTFSFYANKNITTGEGGMVLVQSPALAERARALRNLCFQPKRRFLHEHIGNNYRMTNVQAALGVGQVARIEEIVQRKREIAQRYSELLGDLPGVQLPVEQPWARNVYWVYGVVPDERHGTDCLRITSALAAAGIETRPFFLGMHEQPVFHAMGLFQGECFPTAEGLAKRGFYIPSSLSLTAEQQVMIASRLRSALQEV